MDKVAFEPFGMIQCPGCGDTLLHHSSVVVFEREEDAPLTLVTNCSRTATTTGVVDSDECQNPSGRRHGVTIGFWCEDCDRAPVLEIFQHKGMTFIQWKDQ